jgi:hypothetical protein
MVYECIYVCPASAGVIQRFMFIFGIQEFSKPVSIPTESEHTNLKNRGT